MITSHHWTDNGTPMGGSTYGNGFAISWQNGPLVDADGERESPNGAFVEDIIKAAIDRIEYYQASKYVSEYNASALVHLRFAVDALNARTKDREQRGVEGTKQV